MGTRSRFAAVAGTAIGIAGLRAVRRARRRARLHGAAGGTVDDIMSTVAEDLPPTPPQPGSDEAHAPGHRHLPMTADVRDEQPPPPVRERPFAKHRHGLRHPGRG